MILLLLAAAAMGDADIAAARKVVPADVRALVDRRESCGHWAGEPEWGADVDPRGARAKEIALALRELRCDRLDRDEARLRRRYALRPKILRLLTAARDLY